jgi:hypothetical protein
MAMRPFGEWFPQLGKDECRVVWLPDGAEDIPADGYALLEYYCDEPDCNCRRVILNVVRASTMQSVGMINYGLYSDALPVGPFLDPLHPRARFADSVLQMVDDMVLSDAQYLARLRRHHDMFRARIRGERRAALPTPEQVAQRIDERKRRHKALRRAQRRRR